MEFILNGDTRPIPFYMVQSADHISPLTGASPTVTISKNCAAFGAPIGSVAEVGNGWYALTPNTADTGTNGAFMLHATAASGDPSDKDLQVVAFSPYDSASLGLTAVKISTNIKKNAALNAFSFQMIDATTYLPKTGLTVAGQVSIDGAAYVNLTNSVVEVASGTYKVNLAAADTNGNVLNFKFTAAGANQCNLVEITQP